MRLNEAIGHLVSVLHEWEGWLLNPNFSRQGQQIAWYGFSDPMIEDPITFDTLADLSERGQYTFQIDDGSLIRLLYTFSDNETVSAASLGYYAAPKFEADLELISWIRFDHAPEGARGVIHSVTHLHTSLSDQVRIPVASLPTPRQFVELICAWFYPEIYEKRRGELPLVVLADVFSTAIRHCADTHCKRTAHIAFPGTGV